MSMGVVTSLTPSFTDPSGSVTLMGACSSLAFWSCNIHCSRDSAPVWSRRGICSIPSRFAFYLELQHHAIGTSQSLIM